MSNINSGINRRAVVKGAAWAVPVIAAATAVPLASASSSVEPTDVFIGAFGQDGQTNRGVETFLIGPAPAYEVVPFPAGTTLVITATATANGMIENPTMTGGTLIDQNHSGNVYTFTYAVTEGGTSVRFAGEVTGTVSVQATFSGPFGTLSSTSVPLAGG